MDTLHMAGLYTAYTLLVIVALLLISCIPVVDRLLHRIVCHYKKCIYYRVNPSGGKPMRLYFCDRCGVQDKRIVIPGVDDRASLARRIKAQNSRKP
jgi:hypothetical protein